MSVEQQFIGHWKMDRWENISQYLKANKVSKPLRKVAKHLSVKLQVTKNGDEWTWHYMSSFKNVKLVFKLGEAFDETTVDGRKMKSTYYMEGDKMLCDQIPTNDVDLPSKFIMEISPEGELIQHFISTPTDIRASRNFKRLPTP